MSYAQGDMAEEITELRDVAGGEADALPPMIRVLFVGRRTTAENLLREFTADPAAPPPEGAAPPNALADGIVDGIALIVLTNQKSALRLLRTDPPHVVLVEVDAQPDSRLRFCQALRRRTPAPAIFAVGAESPQGSFVFDGFLPLPMTRARVADAIQRIHGEWGGHVLQRGPFRLNVATRTLVTPRGSRHMTPKQCALLELLMTHANQVVCRGDIMAAIWETSFLEDTRTLDVHMRWLRESIEPDPSSPLYLLTVRGQGYTFQTPEASPALLLPGPLSPLP